MGGGEGGGEGGGGWDEEGVLAVAVIMHGVNCDGYFIILDDARSRCVYSNDIVIELIALVLLI